MEILKSTKHIYDIPYNKITPDLIQKFVIIQQYTNIKEEKKKDILNSYKKEVIFYYRVLPSLISELIMELLDIVNYEITEKDLSNLALHLDYRHLELNDPDNKKIKKVMKLLHAFEEKETLTFEYDNFISGLENKNDEDKPPLLGKIKIPKGLTKDQQRDRFYEEFRKLINFDYSFNEWEEEMDYSEMYIDNDTIIERFQSYLNKY